MRADPRRFTNLAADDAQAEVVADVRRRLDAVLAVANGK